MTIFRIPVLQDFVRTLKDPTEVPSRRTVYALIRLSDVPDFPLNPDPRMPKIKGTMFRTISESAKSNDGKFHSKNRGITLCVKTVDYDNRKAELLLDIPEDKSDGLYGIIDGGHTHAAIRAAVRDLQRESSSETEVLPEQYVRLEIMVGIEESLAEIARARNYSIPLKEWGLEAYQNKFNWLLESLGIYSEFIRIKENEDQPVPIMEVIQILCAINPKLYSGDKSPADAYKNIGKCLDYFVAERDPYEFKKFAPVCRDILRLYDRICYSWDDKYNAPDETGQRGRMGSRVENEKRKRDRDRLLTFYFLNEKNLFGEPQKKQGLPVEKGFAIPVISAFRILLEEKLDGNYGWIEDPFDFFAEHGSKLVRSVMDASRDANSDAQRVGRDRNVYNALYGITQTVVLQSELKRLREEVRRAGNPL